jgi:glycine/serine hydroxymethyltransferase
MATVVELIDRVIQNPESEAELNAVAQEVHALMEGRPLFVVS